jgi:hypothetical protein
MVDSTMTKCTAATALLLLVLQVITRSTGGFGPLPAFFNRKTSTSSTRVGISFIVVGNGEEPIEPDDDDDDDDNEVEVDSYQQAASSEFSEPNTTSSALALQKTSIDWGNEYSKLTERISDIDKGGQTPSKALFQLMISESPNQVITKFLQSANPQVVAAMSGAVSSLLGGLSNPASGIETVVQTTGDKVANLCFQLQMTGYMFRNAEYVIALKDLMKIKGGATLDDYHQAFDRLDSDRSGYIDAHEVEKLLSDVYDDKVPTFEVEAFLKFFDSNRDGRISWQEFERGLGNVVEQEQARAALRGSSILEKMLPSHALDYEEEEDLADIEMDISGTIEIELADGQVIPVEASDYIESLKREAEELKEALQRELGGSGAQNSAGSSLMAAPSASMNEGIASYIASRKNDLQEMADAIEPEIMETMRMLVDFVITGKKKNLPKKEEMEMQIPGSALQQLALWQLVLGYRIREAEATGDYLKLLE